jgi:hypothetical protein
MEKRVGRGRVLQKKLSEVEDAKYGSAGLRFLELPLQDVGS